MEKEKRYLCFTCYGYHPEMRGVSEEEFENGHKNCTEEKCSCKEDLLKPAFYCEKCDKMIEFELEQDHQH